MLAGKRYMLSCKRYLHSCMISHAIQLNARTQLLTRIIKQSVDVLETCSRVHDLMLACFTRQGFSNCLCASYNSRAVKAYENTSITLQAY